MNASEVSIGLAHEIVIRLAKAGAEVSDLVTLSKDEVICQKVISIIRGTTETVFKKFLALTNGHIMIRRLKKPFVVAEHFKVDISGNTKISYLGDNFRNWCLKGTVKPRIGYEVSSYRLTKGMNDGQIRAELNAGHETDLAIVFSLMKKQGNGQPGVLLTGGNWNIFYCPDGAGELRAVVVSWSGGGWDVDADSVASPGGWGEGRQVFSRNSVA